MGAYDTLVQLRTETTITDGMPPEEAAQNMRFLISRVQHQVMADQYDGLRRQLCGILFAQASHMFDAFGTLGTPEVWTQHQDNPDRRKVLRRVAVIAAVVLLLLCLLQMYYRGEILAMVGVGGCALLLLCAYFLRPPKPLQEKYHVTQRVDAEKMMAMVESAMRGIDRDMEALDMLVPSETAGAVQEDVLVIIARMIEFERSGQGVLPPELRHEMNAFLVRQNVTLVEYTDQNATLFQTLPTRSKTTTLAPAMMQGDHLVRRGLAIVASGTQEGG